MDNHEELNASIDRLAAAAGVLEQVARNLADRYTENEEATIGRIVATVEHRREAELERKLVAAEQKIAESEQKIADLEARAAAAPAPGSGRKTLPAAMSNLLAKQGVELGSLEAGALDAALTGLSLEQRMAVKAQLLRAGLLA